VLGAGRKVAPWVFPSENWERAKGDTKSFPPNLSTFPPATALSPACLTRLVTNGGLFGDFASQFVDCNLKAVHKPLRRIDHPDGHSKERFQRLHNDSCMAL
jgi:hypothetical protein